MTTTTETVTISVPVAISYDKPEGRAAAIEGAIYRLRVNFFSVGNSGFHEATSLDEQTFCDALSSREG